MGDNADKKLDALFAAARAARADTADCEEYFETRLMARIAERKSRGVPWYALAWRMVPAFAVIVIITAVWSATVNPARSGDMFAAITAGQEDRLTISYLVGE